MIILSHLTKIWRQKKDDHQIMTNRPWLVDKRFEISNLDLIRDLVNIINIEKEFTEKKKDLF